jgi:hypothetical protein
MKKSTKLTWDLPGVLQATAPLGSTSPSAVMLILTRTKAMTAPVFRQYEGWEWGKIAAGGTLGHAAGRDLQRLRAPLSGARLTAGDVKE